MITVKIEFGSNQGSTPEIVRCLMEIGLRFKNPLTGVITTFNSHGDQIEIGADELQISLQGAMPGSVQLWLNESEDVFMTWGHREMRLFLDGIEADGKKLILNHLVEWFAVSSANSSSSAFRICFELG
jgi:hypothetical protein